MLQLKLKSNEFQRGQIPPQLLADLHPGIASNSKRGKFFVLTPNNHESVELICVIMGIMVSKVKPCKTEKRIPNHIH